MCHTKIKYIRANCLLIIACTTSTKKLSLTELAVLFPAAQGITKHAIPSTECYRAIRPSYLHPLREQCGSIAGRLRPPYRIPLLEQCGSNAGRLRPPFRIQLLEQCDSNAGRLRPPYRIQLLEQCGSNPQFSFQHEIPLAMLF